MKIEIKLTQSITCERVEYLAGQTIKVDQEIAKRIVGLGAGQYPIVATKPIAKEGDTK